MAIELIVSSSELVLWHAGRRRSRQNQQANEYETPFYSYIVKKIEKNKKEWPQHSELVEHNASKEIPESLLFTIKFIQ